MQPMTWLGLAYSVPVNPSKSRVYVWRKLKEFGAGYLKQGVAILPKSSQSVAKFSALAAKIQEMNGEATMIELRFLEPRDEAETISRFQHQSESEYRELLRDCAAVLASIRDIVDPAERSERMRKLVKRYGKVKSRDFFRSRSHADIAAALEDLAGDMAHLTDEIGRQLRGMLDL